MLRALDGGLQAITKVAEYVHNSQSDLHSTGGAPSHGRVAEASEHARYMLEHGLPLGFQDLSAWIDAKNATTDGLDDRKFLLENAVKFMSALPPGNKTATWLQHQFIDLLYKDLPHPPSGYLSTPIIDQVSQPSSVSQGVQVVDQGTQQTGQGSRPRAHEPRIRYASRSNDGSGYNPLFPSLGKAGEPYARSVPSLHYRPASSLPDAGVVFDTLMKRRVDQFTPHPSGISSLFFAFANLIIHTCFNTNYSDVTLNDNSSYLDLSPLYGGGPSRFVKPVEKMRVFDGTGKIWADTFADGRLLYMPPASAALLILFNRNHNFICDKLLNINEHGTFKTPPFENKEQMTKQDDEIFARARLVNCGFFMQIILQDYVGSILGLERDGLKWRLNPLEDTRELSHGVSPRGEGNVCSIEFNLVYRWHATTSQPDDQWTETMFKRMFPGKDYHEVTAKDFKAAAGKDLVPPKDVRKWTFGEPGNPLKRDEKGMFADADLANIIQSATETVAASFQARGSPEWMRVIEILSIEQAREWGTCTLNEFRKFIGLKPLESFKEWNPDESVWQVAEKLYKHIDNLEMYVGIQAEAVKPPRPGAGLCPGYTISRAILGDAVALTRGDPYLTTAMTPYNLTSWGYQDCQADVEDGAYGGMLTRLLLRTLPQYYGPCSALALFPFQVPNVMRGFMENMTIDRSQEYNWQRLQSPIPLHVFKTYTSVQSVLAQPHVFEPTGRGSVALFNPSFGSLVKQADASPVKTALFKDLPKWKSIMEALVTDLSASLSIQHSDTDVAQYLDLAELINVLPCHLVCNNMAGISLKTRSNPSGAWTPREVYEMLSHISNYSFLNLDLTSEWSLREKATKAAGVIISRICGHLDHTEYSGLSLASIKAAITDAFLRATSSSNDQSADFLAHVAYARGKQKPEELARAVVEEVVATAPIWSATITSVVDYYLDDSRKEETLRLVASNDEQILIYIKRALRANSAFTAIRRRARKQASIDGKIIEAGAEVLISLAAANSAAQEGSEPLFNICQRGLMTEAFFNETAPSVVRGLLSLPGLKRAPGASGRIPKFSEEVNGVQQTVFIDSHGNFAPFPASLVVQYSAA